MIEHLINIFCDLNLEEKDVYVFGAGKFGRVICYLLQRFSTRIIAVLDNDSNKWNRQILGIPIRSPESIREFVSERTLVLVGSLWHSEIVVQLESMGFDPDKNMVVLSPDDNPAPSIDFTKPRVVNGVQIGRYTHDVQGLCVEFTPVQRVGSFCSINGSARVATMHPLHHIATSGIFYVQDDNPLLHGSPFKGTVNDLDIQNIKRNGKRLNGPITIGNDVWIGQYVSILSSVKIGNGSVVGAGAVVTSDVPDYAIVVGVPARIIGYRFSQSQIRILNKLAWWDWPEEKIIEEKLLFRNPEQFFSKHAMPGQK